MLTMIKAFWEDVWTKLNVYKSSRVSCRYLIYVRFRSSSLALFPTFKMHGLFRKFIWVLELKIHSPCNLSKKGGIKIIRPLNFLNYSSRAADIVETTQNGVTASICIEHKNWINFMVWSLSRFGFTGFTSSQVELW